jgi:Zn-dependent membrane protease YugP
MLYFAILIPFLLLGFWAQSNVKRTFQRWSEVRSSSGRTGAEVARSILDRNGLTDVQVLHAPGELTDHYDPRKRTVNLSDSVYGSDSVSAVSVAAHEVGHAIQHQKAYAPLAVRSALFPVAAFGSSAFGPLFMVGFVLYMIGNVAGGNLVFLVAVAFFAFAVLFQLVTLPVEFDASRRAKLQLGEMNLYPNAAQEAAGTAKVLNAAALTYVVAALAAVAQLAYYVMILMSRR